MLEQKGSLPGSYLLLVSLAAIFGMSFLLTKIAVADIPPATIVLIRLVIGCLLLALTTIAARRDFASLMKHWKLISVAAFFGNAMPFFLISWGQEKVDAGLTAILMAIMPLMTIVIAHYTTGDEKLTTFKVAGFCLGLLGVAVLIGFERLGSLGEQAIRQYAIMGATLCYAIHAVLSKRLINLNLPRRAMATAVLFASVVMVLPFSLLIDRPWELTFTSESVYALLALGILPTGIGTLMLFAIVNREGAGFLSQINFLVPVFGVFWAIVFLHESLPPNAVLALVIILAGVAIARISPNSEKMEKAS